MKKPKTKRGPTWAGFKPLVGPTKKDKIRKSEKKYKKGEGNEKL